MKRRTKKQREAEAKAALRRRVIDMAVGAEGDSMPALDPDNWWSNANCLSRWLPALKTSFGLDKKGEERQDRRHLWFISNLDNYDNVESATNFLFQNGVRA